MSTVIAPANAKNITTVTTTATNDTYQVSGTITAAGSRTITEVGVFDAAARPTARATRRSRTGCLTSTRTTSSTACAGA